MRQRPETLIGLLHFRSGANRLPWVDLSSREASLVVSMRPFKPADAIRAIQITSRFPGAHGAPVHLGRPDLIGIADLSAPDYGDAVPIDDDELPVFWACGVTPQATIAAARPTLAITHAPGHMLVTDIPAGRAEVLLTGVDP